MRASALVFHKRFRKRECSERHLVVVAKIATFFFGGLLLAFSLWQYEHRGDTALERLGKLSNLIAAPVPAFFLLGIFFKRANTPGVICGALAGIAFALAFNGFPGLMKPVFTGINWMWIAGLGLIASLIVGGVASLLFPPPPPEKTALSGASGSA